MKGRYPAALVAKVGIDALMKVSPTKQKLVNKPQLYKPFKSERGSVMRYSQRIRGEAPAIEYTMTAEEALKEAGLE